MNNNEKKHNMNPPYGSVRKLREIFNLISTRSFSQITIEDLVNRGFSKTDAFQTIAGLKFLKVINDDGTKTENLTKLQLRGKDRTDSLQEIIRVAYNKLFDTAPEANKLSKNELHNEFIALYKLSGRLATTAVPIFIWLCAEAGLEVVEEPDIRERISKQFLKKASSNKESSPKESIPQQGQIGMTTSLTPDSGFQAADLILEHGKAKLLVPNELTEADVSKLVMQINIFANKVDTNK